MHDILVNTVAVIIIGLVINFASMMRSFSSYNTWKKLPVKQGYAVKTVKDEPKLKVYTVCIEGDRRIYRCTLNVSGEKDRLPALGEKGMWRFNERNFTAMPEEKAAEFKKEAYGALAVLLAGTAIILGITFIGEILQG